jgi:hypothetical protein
MFGQLRRNQPRPEIVGAARRITDDNSDRLALEVRSLRRSFNGAKENEKKPNADPFPFHIASLYENESANLIDEAAAVLHHKADGN